MKKNNRNIEDNKVDSLVVETESSIDDLITEVENLLMKMEDFKKEAANNLDRLMLEQAEFLAGD